MKLKTLKLKIDVPSAGFYSLQHLKSHSGRLLNHHNQVGATKFYFTPLKNKTLIRINAIVSIKWQPKTAYPTFFCLFSRDNDICYFFIIRKQKSKFQAIRSPSIGHLSWIIL